jgi:serine/threonine protein kinase
MEYVEGETLGGLLERGADLDPERIARELLAALRAIHDAGIVHRDVKPENVLGAADGRMRLTDFGIAHPEDATRLTQTGEVIGTARFMAPELRAGGDPTVRSDLYSLGVLLRDVCRSEPEGDVAELAAHLSRADPDERPRSASEALAALERGPAPEATDELPAVAPASEGATAEAPVEPPPEDATSEPPVEPARAKARRSFARLSPARLVLAVLALVIALVIAATVIGDSDRGRPLLGPEAKSNPVKGGNR